MVLSSDCEGLVLSAVTVGGDGDLGCMFEAAVVVVIGFSCWYGNAVVIMVVAMVCGEVCLPSLLKMVAFGLSE